MREPARILVVDDNADNVEILRMRLGSLGYEVDRRRTTASRRCARSRADLPDLVLLDIMMPKIDGLEVVRAAEGRHQPAVHADHPGDRQGRRPRTSWRGSRPAATTI